MNGFSIQMIIFATVKRFNNVIIILFVCKYTKKL